MAPVAHEVCYTYAEYLAFERSSNVRHEFLEGQIFGMAGGSPEHAALAAAVSGLLFSQLAGGRCRTFSSDLRIRVAATGLATYPDLAVVCGPLEHDPEDDQAVVNPALLVEVLSPSTELYDRGEKLEHYRKIAALQVVLLVAQDAPRVEVIERQQDGAWSRRVVGPGERIPLPSIGAELEIDRLYESVRPPTE